jgi:serine/threonine-protein kinase HipA
MTIGGLSIPDTIQLQHWLTLVPATRGAQRLLVKDMKESAEWIRGEADALLAELEGAGITHAILKTVRGIIETRASHLIRITEKA